MRFDLVGALIGISGGVTAALLGWGKLAAVGLALGLWIGIPAIIVWVRRWRRGNNA